MLEVIYALWRRDMIKFLRDRRQLITSLTRPLLWLLAFGFGLRASVRLPSGGPDFVSFLVPGLAAMTVLFASMFAAISIVWEREFGFLKELLVAPVPRGAIVAAKILAGSSTAMIETAMTLLLAPLFGARYSPLGALAALPVLLVFGMGVNALGIIVAARMRSFEGFGSIVNFVIQPVFFLSGALYPVAGLPHLLHGLVLANPMSYAVDAVRGLCLGHRNFPLALSVGVVVGSSVVLAALASRAFRRMEA
ncbi:MAG TPA: ABC transporter permease [Polyangia bacterium]|nr:ABC transporter permease [Polyangia bacterium]